MRIGTVGMTLVLMMICGEAVAAETRIVVRALAKDAKFIGTSVEGAEVIIRDAATAEVMARGITTGGTGDTRRLVTNPKSRGESLSSEGAAKFEAVLDITEPRLLTIEVAGPLSHPQAVVKSTTQVWLLPGKHLLGDGVILEVPGFALNLLEPGESRSFTLEKGRARIPIRLSMIMM